jgi:undecaprenyl-diphosphatase
VRHAALLGLAHGPTELLPVSSSAHTALIPLLARWPEAELDPELRKALEVALHAGGALALLLATRRETAATARALDRRQAALLALSLVPPTVVGYTLRRPIERRLGGPRPIAAGLLAGSLAMALADRPRAPRALRDAGARDGLLLGLAQALALAPGISRNGATLATARARGYSREDAQTLSWRVALPVILGASALKAWRLSRQGASPGAGRALAAGAAGAFLSTLAAAPLIAPARRGRPLLPFALYRCALAGLAIAAAPRTVRCERPPLPSQKRRVARHRRRPIGTGA